MNDLTNLVLEAASDLAPLFPLDEAVAVNPLLDVTDRPFAEALWGWSTRYGHAPWPNNTHLDEARRRGLDVPATPSIDRPGPRGATAYERVADDVRRPRARRAVGATLLEALGVSDDRDALTKVREVLAKRGGWAELSHRHRVAVKDLLDLPVETLALHLVGSHEVDLVEEFARHFARLPGWAGWAKWNTTHPTRHHPHGLGLDDLLTVSLAVDLVLLEGRHAPAPRLERATHTTIPERLRVLEHALTGEFVARLSTPATPTPRDPLLQVVCCIDPRSEPLRRALERDDRVETLAMAGFFGLPVSVAPPGLGYHYEGLPALAESSAELVSDDRLDPLTRATRLTLDALGDLTHEPESMFALAEVSGWATGLVTVAGVSRPDLVGRRRRVHQWRVEHTNRVDLAEGALRQSGLTHFAPHVLLLGHGALSVANAHYSSLECGACGAHPGGPNAAGLAEVLNDPDVRAGLSERGLAIPATTRFYSGEHLTTLADVDLSSDTPEEVREILNVATTHLAKEHGARLGARESTRRRDLRRRAHDWSEVRPEWGLAGHVGLVIGPRRSTRGVDFAGRVFLHSYDAVADPSGDVLVAIVSGALVVAQWINSSYYFSSVAPDILGAGDKTRLNPVSDFAVVLGDDPDLRVGLPRQSLERDDGPEHLPSRLVVVIEAPSSRVADALSRAPDARRLVEGEWVHLFVRETPERPLRRFIDD